MHRLAAKAFGLLHFRRGFELTFQIETPEVIGAHEEARVATTGRPFGFRARALPFVGVAGRHDVGAAMRTHAGQHPHYLIFATHQH